MRIGSNPGRIAGFWYLLLILLGPLRLMYIPSKLFVQGNATATVRISLLTNFSSVSALPAT